MKSWEAHGKQACDDVRAVLSSTYPSTIKRARRRPQGSSFLRPPVGRPPPHPCLSATFPNSRISGASAPRMERSQWTLCGSLVTRPGLLRPKAFGLSHRTARRSRHRVVICRLTFRSVAPRKPASARDGPRPGITAAPPQWVRGSLAAHAHDAAEYGAHAASYGRPCGC